MTTKRPVRRKVVKAAGKRDILWVKAIESCLQRRIKHIGNDEQIYTGYPSQLMSEIRARKRELSADSRRAYMRKWQKDYRDKKNGYEVIKFKRPLPITHRKKK